MIKKFLAKPTVLIICTLLISINYTKADRASEAGPIIETLDLLMGLSRTHY